ncbi:hypothetical protein SAMN06265222_101637 [Neorhodopirellula lusitana]|uniref:NrS-1 polymerase-like HBD domain-containing protein n=1 Tax=Neorhodopirellula lusitana TaxID=445327 RepID=A0ABY1PSM8_9BACT|nr:hypothetical protein [Neorhodopirellula lusitana]SMP41706.1 hypothetical protein SAMN06265222_101637 [Neorhodopirellula lusitana]
MNNESNISQQSKSSNSQGRGNEDHEDKPINDKPTVSCVSSKPSIDANAVPEMLRCFDQWVCWKYVQDHGSGRRRKVPVNPKSRRFASVNDRSTWTSIDEAIQTYSKHLDELDGIGFVFTMGDPFIGIDLDDCRNLTTGNLSSTAYDILERISTYTEVSPSGTGVKAIATIDSVISSRRRSDPEIEIYSSGRFFTITTQTIDGNLRVRDATDAMPSILSLYFDDRGNPDRDIPLPAAPSCAADRTVLGKAMAARNGDKFRELWGGSSREFKGNQSQADLSLCRLLAFWCGPCVEQIDRLFRSSGLFRSKWDERHFSSGATYGTETIQRAIAAQDNTFYRWQRLPNHDPKNE